MHSPNRTAAQGPSPPEPPGYQRPPILAGYTWDPADAYRARDDRRLLAIRLETNHSCNLRCRYCYARSHPQGGDVVDYALLEDVVVQAHELGARAVVVIGGGEPTLHPRFRDLIARIDGLGMIPVVFTNGIAVDEELAAHLAEHHASVMGKLDSLRPDVQDYLAGRPHASRGIYRGLQFLMAAGLARGEDPHRLRLGASFVSCRLNLQEVEDVWHFCRRQHVFPNIEVLTPTGRATDELAGQGLATDVIQACKRRLLEVDREAYGYDWLPHTPLVASGCLQHLYSLYITVEGHVRPCAPTKFDEHPALRVNGEYPHNVRRRTLREIYDDPLFVYVRNIDKHLEGKCGGCEHLHECIGCRGYSYSVGVNEGKGPREALRGECLQCAR